MTPTQRVLTMARLAGEGKISERTYTIWYYRVACEPGFWR